MKRWNEHSSPYGIRIRHDEDYKIVGVGRYTRVQKVEQPIERRYPAGRVLQAVA